MPYKDRRIQNKYLRNYMKQRYKEIKKLLNFYYNHLLPKRQQIELILGAPIPEIKIPKRRK